MESKEGIRITIRGSCIVSCQKVENFGRKTQELALGF